MRDKIQAKLDQFKSEIDDLKNKVTAIDKTKKDREGKLSKVEEPIKRLLDEKIAMQKKIDQKVLDNCSKFLSKHSNDDVVFIM